MRIRIDKFCTRSRSVQIDPVFRHRTTKGRKVASCSARCPATWSSWRVFVNGSVVNPRRRRLHRMRDWILPRLELVTIAQAAHRAKEVAWSCWAGSRERRPIERLRPSALSRHENRDYENQSKANAIPRYQASTCADSACTVSPVFVAGCAHDRQLGYKSATARGFIFAERAQSDISREPRGFHRVCRFADFCAVATRRKRPGRYGICAPPSV